jgi:dTDP-4-dehydrorhamnose 3,5-epimerase
MKFTPTPLEGLLIVEPRIATDDRGYFFESFHEKRMLENNIGPFVQDNQSVSHKGVLRGLHFQKAPHEQGKLVRVISGRALDIAVDIRNGSPTFGKHFALELNGSTNIMLWIPPGFAHGFVALDDNTIFLYKVTSYYDPSSECGLLLNDAYINIDCKISDPVISRKDRILPTFREFRQQLV